MKEKVYKEIFDRIQVGECAWALVLVADELTKSPDDPYLLYYAGLAHRRLNEYDEAKQFYRRSIDADPRNASVHLGLGIIYQIQEMFDDAIESLKMATALDPHFPEAHNSLGLTYSKIGDYREALESYERAAEAIINMAYQQLNTEGQQFTSRVTTDGNRTLMVEPDAFDQVERILKANPMWAINRNNIGCCLAAIGEKQRAKEMLKESINFIPEGLKYDAPFVGLTDLENE
ncbi:MAG: tetratricopeptide repeat protein [Pyrinomonadaceae bacterium]